MTKDLTHRPWPRPKSPWCMKQRWHDLLFMHWPVPVSSLEPFIPKNLQLDTFEGKAWIAIVPFHMSGIRLNWLPELPGLSVFPELNVRTYVTDGSKPGVWFFSLDALNPLAVIIARKWYRLPYFHAQMSLQMIGGSIHYKSRRKMDKTTATGPELTMQYAPMGDPYLARKGTLEHWLTERYCLYAQEGDDLYRAEVHHAPWELQPAKAKILTNTMTKSLPVPLPKTQPLLHFSALQEVLVWPPEKLSRLAFSV